MQTINIETNQQDDYQVRESYRNLRTNIFLSGKDTKVVMFTSCPQLVNITTFVSLQAVDLMKVNQQ